MKQVDKKHYNKELANAIRKDHTDSIELRLGEHVFMGDFRTNKSGSYGYLVNGKATIDGRKVQVSANVTYIGTNPST